MASTTPLYPTRFREGEARGARYGRALRLIGGVRAVDESLMDRLGRGFLERDELGARLAGAMRTRADDGSRVSRSQFKAALTDGIDSVTDAPPALVEFLKEVSTVPDWVDRDLLEQGARLLHRLGQNAGDVGLQLSLIGGYRFGGPADLLVATGGLTGDMTMRRLGETQKWTTSLGTVGAVLPGGEAWRLTVHVRLMHAMVNASFEPTWDSSRWGLPINQTDLASTLALFDATMLLGCRALGVRITRAESRAWMHMWRYVGYLLGVDPDFWVTTERERCQQAYHVLRSQTGQTDAGVQLAQAAVRVQLDRNFPGWPVRLQAARARFERERLLGMLTYLVGIQSMRDLELPIRPPWPLAYVIPMNIWRYQVMARSAAGQGRLEAWGERVRDRILASYFGTAEPDVGALPN